MNPIVMFPNPWGFWQRSLPNSASGRAYAGSDMRWTSISIMDRGQSRCREGWWGHRRMGSLAGNPNSIARTASTEHEERACVRISSAGVRCGHLAMSRSSMFLPMGYGVPYTVIAKTSRIGKYPNPNIQTVEKQYAQTPRLFRGKVDDQ